MPEIAEVQSAVNQLNPWLWSKTIVRVEVAPWFLKARGDQVKAVVGWTCSGVSRRGKSILFEFDNPGRGKLFLLSRLGMVGHWLIAAPSWTGTAVVSFDLMSAVGAERLVYVDTRRAGTLQLGDRPDFDAVRMMGPDLLGDHFSVDWIVATAGRHRAPVKALLMRPEYFPGVGNWVANEALFRAGVPPTLPGRDLTVVQAARLASALILTVRSAIAKGGATVRDWRNPDGSPGTAQEDFCVYARDGKQCYLCGELIRKVKVMGRPTFFCPNCQSGIESKPVSDGFVSEVVKATLVEGAHGRG